MTFPQRRLAELDAISRQRPLTDAEQREVLLRAKQDRNNRYRRVRYWLDEQYRAVRIAQSKPRQGVRA